MSQQRRAHFRTKPLPETIQELSFWFTMEPAPNKPYDPNKLGQPSLRLNTHNLCKFTIEDLSATGMSLQLSKTVLSKHKTNLISRRCLLYLALRRPHNGSLIKLLLLAQIIHTRPTNQDIFLGLQFIAHARFFPPTGSLFFFDIQNTGVNKLAAWASAHFFYKQKLDENDITNTHMHWLHELD